MAKKLKEDKKENEVELSSLGFSVIKQGKVFKLVRIKFDIESGNAEVEDIEDIHRNNIDYDIALYEAKKFLVENIMRGLTGK